ncbi:MAG: ribosomal-protein-alanine N-acetyltransferase [Candidatus Omnitrophota bacterium]|nr:MAG: ribosomal-protein-alanine N-acetyltransferase [Candidatus Omnitrophota bacterium]
MSIRIRPLLITDIAQIHEIEKLSFSEPWSKRMFFSELEAQGYNHSLVAVDNASDHVVGYCCFWILEGDEIHINNIATHPDYRRKGIAQTLMREATAMGLQQCAQSVTLEVRESNTAARSFYERLGFCQVGKRIGYYCKPKEDALILRKPI